MGLFCGAVQFTMLNAISEIMMALGLHPCDRVLLEFVDGQVRLRSASRVNLVDRILEE